MKKIIRAVLFLTLFAMTPVPRASSVDTAKPEDVGLSSERLQRIHQTIQRHIGADDISGAVTIVARKGRIAHFETHGVMDLDSKKPMAKDTIFRIASMSKPVTATAILILMEEGKIRLTDPVSKFIPQFKDMKVAVAQGSVPALSNSVPRFYTVPADREITIRDLLTHVSGLASGPMSNSETAKLNPQNAILPLELLAEYIPKLGATPLEFQPGSRWSYSPLAGFDTLGRIVEVASGQTFDQFLQQRVFDPLGMKDTYFWAQDRAPSITRRSSYSAQRISGAKVP